MREDSRPSEIGKNPHVVYFASVFDVPTGYLNREAERHGMNCTTPIDLLLRTDPMDLMDNKTYCTIHAYRDDAIIRALDAGVTVIEHGFLMSEPTVKRLADENIVLSAQVVMSIDAFAHPEEVPWFSPEQIRKAKQVNVGAAQMFEWCKKYDVFMVLGGDMFAEQTPHAKTNITAMERFGYEPWEVLEMATSKAGKVLDMSGPARSPYREGPLGVIKAGSYADLIIWEKSPLEDLKNILPNENLKMIMKDGLFMKNEL